MQNDGLSIIIPVFNEEKEIGGVIDKIIQSMEGHNLNYELIVVNDASTDNTLNEVKEKNVRLINHSVNLGYGASLKDGVKNAKYDVIAITDGDGTYSVEDILEMFGLMNEYSMIVGSRRNKIVYPTLNIIKNLCRRLIEFFTSYLTNAQIPDINSGLRIFKKELVVKFMDQLCDRFSFTTSLTLLTLFNEFKVKYVPIDYCFSLRRQSKVRIWWDSLKTVILIFRISFQYAPLRLFFFLCIFFILTFLMLVVIKILI